MKTTLTVCLKEAKSFLRPSFFLVVAFCSIYFGLYYYSILLEYANISKQAVGSTKMLSYAENLMIPYFSSINFVLLIVCPLIAIRLFSEEYKNNTFEFLLSAPITSWQIVLGKYLAACLIVTFIVLLAVGYLLTSLFLVDLPVIQILSAFIGLVLISYIYLAISLFASSLTSSVVLAGIISIVLCLSFWLLAAFRISEDGSYVAWANHLWLGTHLMSFLRGGIDIKAVSILSSYIFFFLFITQQSVETNRWR